MSESLQPTPKDDLGTLDIGSNAVKLTLLKNDPNNPELLYDGEVVTRFAESPSDPLVLSGDAMERTLDAVRRLLAEAGIDAHRVDAAGSWWMRRAKNAREFAGVLRYETGIHLRALSEEEEASSTFLAVRHEVGQGVPLVTVDHGGGSTDIASGEDDLPETHLSLPLGARRLSAAVPLSSPPKGEEIESIRRETRELLENLQPLPPGREVVLTGGAASLFASAAGKLLDTESAEPLRVLAPETLDLIVQRLGSLTLEQRRELLAPSYADRADVVLHSAVAMRELLGALGVATATVSFRGPGHGLLLSSLLGVPLDGDAPVVTLPSGDFPPLSREGRNGEVLFALLSDQGKLWMQRKSTYAKGIIRLPGGGIDGGESSFGAVLRELGEETGLANPNPRLLGRIRYRLPDGTPLRFTSDLWLVPAGDHIPVTSDPHEQTESWQEAGPDKLLGIEEALRSLDGELHAWGQFRAAAIQYLRQLHARMVW